MSTQLGGGLSRRDAMKLGLLTSGALIVGCRHLAQDSGTLAAGDDLPSPFAGYLQISPDNKIRFVTTRSESGQGISGGFGVLVGEELDVDPGTVEIAYAGVNNLLKTLSDTEQNSTGGSSSTRLFYLPVRKTAAAARDMLIAAGAAAWSVPAAECTVKDGSVLHTATQRTATFGSLATAAAALPVPQNPALKPAAAYRYIGKANRRADVLAKITGAATFGIDVKVDRMLTGTIVHCPFVGGDLSSLDDTATKAMPGVKDVIKSPYGVIVLADSYWKAVNGAKKLKAQWTQTSTASSDQILTTQKQLVEANAMVAGNTGNFQTAFTGAAKKVEAYYQVPYLPHTTLEPQNCTAVLRADGTAEIWAPTQDPASAQGVAQTVLGIDADKIKINTTLLGGGFGRRLRQDYVAEACYAAKAVPGTPVKLIWTRAEEFTHDLFRPSAYCKMQAGLDAGGNPVAWMHRIASSSIYSWLDESPSNTITPEKRTSVDSSSTDGADSPSYKVANFRCEWAQHEPGVPVFWWRSVGHSQNAFFVESFIDECAHAANIDPLQYRLNLLTDARTKAVLELVRDKSGWATPPPAGTGRGVAVHASFGSIVAEVAEVTVQTGTIFVQKVTVAVDCGTAMDSGLVHTQMESCIAQALAATLKQQITVTNGKVNETTLNACQPLTLSEMPAVQTFLVPSTGTPGGIGEAGVPPLAAAVANAVFMATNQRLRSLPLKLT